MENEIVKKLTESELKVMEVLWSEGDSPARHVADVMEQRCGWNVNSTYTLLKRCIAKGAVTRQDPGFVCHPLITREEARLTETESLLDRMFDGSVDLLFTALLDSKKLNAAQIRELKQRLTDLEKEEQNA